MARSDGTQARPPRDAGRRLSPATAGPAPVRVPGRRHTAWAVVAGLTVTLLATGLLLGAVVGAAPRDGVFLFRDFVTVPDPVFGANTLGGAGAPRAVPLDAVVTALSGVLSAGVVARLLLVAPLLLVGSGMTVLLRRHGPVATAVGAGLAITNPYVAERLLLGQAPSLLGFAMIPWLVVAVRSRLPLSVRVLLVLAAAIPAGLTPVGAVTAAVTVLVTVLAVGPRTGRPPLRARALECFALLAPVVLVSLPWILAGLAHPTAGAAADGANAFAVRSDGPLGVVGSVATLGGVWAGGAVPDSRGTLWVVLLQGALVLAAVLAWWLLRGRATRAAERGRHPASPRPRTLDVVLAAYLGTVVAVLLLAGPLMPAWRLAQQVPGVALLRDTHRWLGWAALAVAALVALGAAQLARLVRARLTEGLAEHPDGGGRRSRLSELVAAGGTAAMISLGVLTVPDVPGRLAVDLRSVAMPSEWHTVVELVNAGDGRVLVLPWQPFRQVDWVGPVQFLDPFPRALEPEVVHARDLTVRRDGVEWNVGGEDPPVNGVGEGVLDTAALRAAGITRVLIWQGSPGEVPRHEGLTVTHEGTDWVVLELPGE